MNSYKFLFVLLISSVNISFITSCSSDGQSNLISTLTDMAEQIPAVFEEVKKMPECRASSLYSICKTHPEIQIKYYMKFGKQLNKTSSDFKNFIDYYFDIAPIEASQLTEIKEIIMSEILHTNFTSTHIFEVFTIKDNRAYFYTLLFDQMCYDNDQLELVYANLDMEYKSDKNMVVLYEKTHNFWGPKSKRITLYKSGDIANSKYDALLKLMESLSLRDPKSLIPMFKQ